jgi:transposase|nr:transposase [Rhodoferax sp.]
MLKDSETPRYAVRRTKRTYSAETKAELLAACKAPGASIAAIASSHGMNANVLHRWLKDSSQASSCTGSTALDMTDRTVPAFIAVPLPAQTTEPVEREIKVEVRKGSLAMTVTWPMSAASEFASWSASVLK